MPPPNPPRPPYSPCPGAGSPDSDRDLVARLGPSGTGAEVPLLMARHWRATHAYASICLATAGSAASIVTAAAFHRLLGQSSCGALRPYLLMTVRDTVKEWVADESISAVLPELRKPTGGRGLRAARPATPERRQLAERAFRALPDASQCLLWHAEVEADPLSVPARLLGIDTATASAALERAREQFRLACVGAHHEYAPTAECRHHNRLIGLPVRRGGSPLPDVRRHLAHCRYCRHAAEQLGHFEDDLGTLLAETVLGWGARRYLDSRPVRAAARTAPVRRHRRPAPARVPRSSQARARAVVGVGVLSLALLATVLVSDGGLGDNGVPDPRGTWSAEHTTKGTPATGTAATRTLGPDSGRFVNLGTGLCLDVRGSAPRPLAPAVLAGCSAAGSQQWSYQDDGFLRSAADPSLCVASPAGGGAVRLAGCSGHGSETRYDLTVHGELLARDDGRGALAPGPGRTVTVADRDLSADQSWRFEAATAEPRRERSPGAGPDRAPTRDRQPYATRLAAADGGTAPEPALGADRPEPAGALPARLTEALTTLLSRPHPRVTTPSG
ncbi:ricin-type beta-trefoil lectin domain protein [Streptomyces sp. NPDC058867]|uniref:ricin-type beta-trefoil lectin domain protein n=1 Tax=unclassified Streptomyces TaxID=2593676 RepID=UPI003677F835